MCGNVKAPSIVGLEVVINKTPLIGSFYGPLNPGVVVRIDEEVNIDHTGNGDALRAEYRRNTGNEHPGYYYATTMVRNPAGESLEGLPSFMVNWVILFRDEFDLID